MTVLHAAALLSVRTPLGRRAGQAGEASAAGRGRRRGALGVGLALASPGRAGVAGLGATTVATMLFGASHLATAILGDGYA